MKKIFLTAMLRTICLLALLPLAVTTLAQQAPATRYLMLVRETISGPAPLAYRTSLTVIAPDGSIKTEEFMVYRDVAPKKVINASIVKALPDSSTAAVRRARYNENQVYQAENKKLNELGSQGWVLVNTLQEGGNIRYLFRQGGNATN